ncbi:MAG: integrase core domain-containing protein, partial [Candidatus Izimaplasma sp.]|nr:integrase core domain-containing protein [Candidatus Izimaplasma bacterium]
FPFEIQEVRTDNGREYTNRLAADHPTFTLFEQTLKLYQINHDYIKPYTPRHNGKVERSHRKDNERFYHKRSFINLKDLRGQGKKYLREYNNFPMSPLDWLSPIQHYTLFRYRIILSRLIFK